MFRSAPPRRFEIGATIARVFQRDRRPSRAMAPGLDDTHCSVYTYCGPFRVRSYGVALRVRAAFGTFGGYVYRPKSAQ